jgi:hypothetical protein
MFAVSDPDLFVAQIALCGLAVVVFWRLIVWVRDSPTRPDPWDAETQQKLSEPDAVEVCPHCLTPQSSTAWFCARCGRAVGPYNNLMPFLNVFSEGEVFRNGMTGRFRNRPLVLIGFILISLSSYFIFAPVYLFLLLANWRRSSAAPAGDAEGGPSA